MVRWIGKTLAVEVAPVRVFLCKNACRKMQHLIQKSVVTFQVRLQCLTIWSLSGKLDTESLSVGFSAGVFL